MSWTTIRKKIKKARKEANFTQGELAKKIGYTSRQSVSNLENGHTKATVDGLIKIGEVLGLDVDMIVIDDD